MSKQLKKASDRLKREASESGKLKLLDKKTFQTTYFNDDLKKSPIKLYSDEELEKHDNWQHLPYGNLIISYNADNPGENNIKFFTTGAWPRDDFAEQQLKHFALSISYNLWHKYDYPVLEVANNIAPPEHGKFSQSQTFSNPLIYMLKALKAGKIEEGDIIALMNCLDDSSIDELIDNMIEDSETCADALSCMLSTDSSELFTVLSENHKLNLPAELEDQEKLYKSAKILEANKCLEYFEQKLDYAKENDDSQTTNIEPPMRATCSSGSFNNPRTDSEEDGIPRGANGLKYPTCYLNDIPEKDLPGCVGTMIVDEIIEGPEEFDQ